MTNKGALGVTNLLDNIPGIEKILTDKKVIEENKNGWGGLSFNLNKDDRRINHKIFLNFKDLYDVTIEDKKRDIKESLKDLYVMEVNELLTWFVKMAQNTTIFITEEYGVDDLEEDLWKIIFLKYRFTKG